MNKILILVFAFVMFSSVAYGSKRMLYPFTGQTDEEYYGSCDPDTRPAINETCSSDPAIDKMWKDALKCGWYHAYGVFQSSGMGLQKVLDNTEGAYDLIGCVAAQFFSKFGYSLCYMYSITGVAINFAAQAEGVILSDSEILNKAEAAVQGLSSTFTRNSCNGSS